MLRAARIVILVLAVLLPLVTLFLVYYYRVDTPEALGGAGKGLIVRNPVIDSFVETLTEFAPPVSINPADFQKKTIFE